MGGNCCVCVCAFHDLYILKKIYLGCGGGGGGRIVPWNVVCLMQVNTLEKKNIYKTKTKKI